jgi:hypothetical protein
VSVPYRLIFFLSNDCRTTNIVRMIEEILRSYRKKSRMVSDNTMLDLVAAMEEGGEDYCSQMDPAVFSVVLDTLLQADTYMEAQRGICLLAVRNAEEVTFLFADGRRLPYIGIRTAKKWKLQLSIGKE